MSKWTTHLLGHEYTFINFTIHKSYHAMVEVTFRISLDSIILNAPHYGIVNIPDLQINNAKDELKTCPDPDSPTKLIVSER